ncbi:MAG TPA: DsbA family oxidoreductase [Acidimicrobiia bacterium]|nr:DsbA family oxidoreductase [Acidimicrobiia bacterium]
MRVEIWSDVVCPWCYVGKRNFEAALAQFEHRDDVEVIWRAFELDPSAPVERQGDYATHLARKYGMSVEQAQNMIDTMTATGAKAGVVLDFNRARPGNSFDAHRLIHLAGEQGVQDAAKERFLRATFTDGEPIGDRDALLRLAVEAGLPEDEAAAVLASDAHADDVRAEESLALELGISAVPFFVIDRKFGVPGAQAPDVILRALQRAWEKAERPLEPAVDVTATGAPGCDGDACGL